METNSSDYKLLEIIGVVSLVVFVLGYPCFVVIHYLIGYAKIHTPEQLNSFTKATGSFRVKNFGFLWESVLLVRKVSLLLVSEFVDRPLFQWAWTVIILILSICVMATMIPYRKTYLNYLQYFMTLTCIVNASIGFMGASQQEIEVSYFRSNEEVLANVTLGFQAIFLITALIATVMMTPQLVKGIRELVISKLTRVCNRKDKSNDQKSSAKSPKEEDESKGNDDENNNDEVELICIATAPSSPNTATGDLK